MLYTIAEYFAIFIVTTEKRHNCKRQIYTLLQNILQSLLLPQTNVTTAKVRFIFVSYPKTDRCQSDLYTIAEQLTIFIVATDKCRNRKGQIYYIRRIFHNLYCYHGQTSQKQKKKYLNFKVSENENPIFEGGKKYRKPRNSEATILILA